MRHVSHHKSWTEAYRPESKTRAWMMLHVKACGEAESQRFLVKYKGQAHAKC